MGTLPPTTSWKPLDLALLANGDRKLGSCESFRAISAMLFAQA
jgi:hypothetical protein